MEFLTLAQWFLAGATAATHVWVVEGGLARHPTYTASMLGNASGHACKLYIAQSSLQQNPSTHGPPKNLHAFPNKPTCTSPQATVAGSSVAVGSDTAAAPSAPVGPYSHSGTGLTF